MELTPEQLDEVRVFAENTGAKLFSELQAAFIAEWMAADSIDQREECWRMVQAAQRLQTLLRDSNAMTLLSQRARARLYERATTGV